MTLFLLFLQKNDIPEFFTCIEFSPNGDVFTGDSNGSIIVWGKGIRKHFDCLYDIAIIQVRKQQAAPYILPIKVCYILFDYKLECFDELGKVPWVGGAMHDGSQACRYPWQGVWKVRGSANRVDVGPMTPQEKTKHLPLAQPELLTHMSTQCVKQSLGKHLLSATSKAGEQT